MMSEINDEYKAVEWLSKLDKCPKCNQALHVMSESNKSITDSINNLVRKLDSHLDICIGNDVKKITNFDIRLKKKTLYDGVHYVRFEWIVNKIII
jgi:hypothetical protein